MRRVLPFAMLALCVAGWAFAGPPKVTVPTPLTILPSGEQFIHVGQTLSFSVVRADAQAGKATGDPVPVRVEWSIEKLPGIKATIDARLGRLTLNGLSPEARESGRAVKVIAKLRGGKTLETQTLETWAMPYALEELGIEGPVAIPAGGVAAYHLRFGRCCWIPYRVDIPAKWNVAPDDGKVRLDLVGRTLHVAADAVHGREYSLRAEFGGIVANHPFKVYVPRRNPIVGAYREVARIACDGEKPFAGRVPIAEFDLRGDGTFAVTWRPFERYVDYWGRYALDPDAGTVHFEVTGGNYVPGDLVPAGSYVVEDNGRLTLKTAWLGTTIEESGQPKPCGMEFERR